MISNGKKNEFSKFNEIFIENYNENSNTGCFLKVDIDYTKKLFNFHKDLPFLPEREKSNKVEKLICSTEDKEKYVMHMSLKTCLKSQISIKKSTQSNSI